MASLWRAATKSPNSNPIKPTRLRLDRVLVKPRTNRLANEAWRRRWFVLKQGKLFWFKDSGVTRVSKPRGVIPVATCLTVKGAEDVLNKPGAFEMSARTETMYFVAESEKGKEDWINSIGRSII